MKNFGVIYNHPNSDFKLGLHAHTYEDHDGTEGSFNFEVFKWAVEGITKYSYTTVNSIDDGVKFIEEKIAEEAKEKEEEWGHLILYAKGWYKKSENRLNDIKQIFAFHGLLFPEDVTDEHMCRVLTDIVYKYTTQTQFENTLMDAIGVKYQDFPVLQGDLSGTERFIRVMCSKLFEVSPKGKLPKPVSEVLPLGERKETQERIKNWDK